MCIKKMKSRFGVLCRNFKSCTKSSILQSGYFGRKLISTSGKDLQLRSIEVIILTCKLLYPPLSVSYAIPSEVIVRTSLAAYAATRDNVRPAERLVCKIREDR